MTKNFKLGLFSPKIRINKIRNLSSFSQLDSEDGFTLVELIVVVMMIGVLSSIAIPQFMTAADKAKQKEATGIVSALVKAATAFQVEYGSLPANHLDLSEFAKFQKCSATNANDPENGGAAVCKDARPQRLDDDETQFISPSGHYQISFQRTNDGSEFQVLANPFGRSFMNNGSAVTGCYRPQDSLSEVYEYSAKQADKGQQLAYRGCVAAAEAE